MSGEAQLLAGMAAIAALGGMEDIPQVKSTKNMRPLMAIFVVMIWGKIQKNVNREIHHVHAAVGKNQNVVV